MEYTDCTVSLSDRSLWTIVGIAFFRRITQLRSVVVELMTLPGLRHFSLITPIPTYYHSSVVPTFRAASQSGSCKQWRSAILYDASYANGRIRCHSTTATFSGSNREELC